MFIIWLYIALNRTPNIDCYLVGAVPKVENLWFGTPPVLFWGLPIKAEHQKTCTLLVTIVEGLTGEPSVLDSRQNRPINVCKAAKTEASMGTPGRCKLTTFVSLNSGRRGVRVRYCHSPRLGLSQG